jgi:hypothetical protein
MTVYRHNGKGTLTQAIIDYISGHPGATRAEIVEGIGYNGSPLTISNVLARLRRTQVVEHRGGPSGDRLWNIVDNKALPVFLKMAENILQELAEIHPSVRVAYLAQRLEDLLAETIEENLE